MRRVRLLPLLAAALVLVGLGTAAASPAGAAEPARQPALSNLASCLSADKRGDLLLLIDQSKSLATTDPHKVRISAAKDLVASFGSIDGLQLSVRVAGFSSDYSPVGNSWTRFTAQSRASIDAEIDAVGAAPLGIDTDYWTALEGARKDLATQRETSGGQAVCQVVVWVSDGELYIQDRGQGDGLTAAKKTKPYYGTRQVVGKKATEEATGLAAQSLCNGSHQGPVNALRAAGVFLVGVGLSSPAKAPDFSLMQALATSSAGAKRCGTATSPPTGAFLKAENVDDLVIVLGGVTSGSEPSTEPVPPGASQTSRIVLDASVRTATILADADLDGVTISVRGPSGAVVRVPAAATGSGSIAVGGIAVPYSWRAPHTVRLLLRQPSDLSRWLGTWTLTFAVPRQADRSALTRTSITVQGDLRPALVSAPTSIRSGTKRVPLTFGILRADGRPVTPGEIKGTALLSATLTLPDGRSQHLLPPATPAQLGTPVPLDATGLQAGIARVVMTLDVTTATPSGAPGTKLTPQIASENLRILPPLGYPTFPSSVRLPQIEGTSSRSTVLPVTGPGCVWIDGSVLDAVPDGVRQVDLAFSPGATRASCLRVPAGKTMVLQIRVTPRQQGNGALDGVLHVGALPLEKGQAPQKADVTVAGEMVKTADTALKIGWLLLALLVGLGLPPAFLVLLRWRGAVMPPGTGGLHSGVIGVSVAGTSVVAADGSPLAIVPSMLQAEALGHGKRELPLAGAPGIRLRTRGLGNPFTPADVLVTADDRRALASDTGGVRSGGSALLPLAVQGHWVAWRGPGESEARVLVLLSGAAQNDSYESMAQSIRRLLPRLLSQLPTDATPPGGQPTGAASSSGGPIPTGPRPVDDW